MLHDFLRKSLLRLLLVELVPEALSAENPVP